MSQHNSVTTQYRHNTTVSQLKSVIFQERLLKVLKCYNFLWVQRRHNCSPAASFANCVMTLYLLKVHLKTFLSVPITQKCQILSCDTLVANERYIYIYMKKLGSGNILANSFWFRTLAVVTTSFISHLHHHFSWKTIQYLGFRSYINVSTRHWTFRQPNTFCTANRIRSVMKTGRNKIALLTNVDTHAYRIKCKWGNHRKENRTELF